MIRHRDDSDRTADLAAERHRRRERYLDYGRLDAALRELEAISEDIRRSSRDIFGREDVLAYEIWAYVAALRRSTGRQGPR